MITIKEGKYIKVIRILASYLGRSQITSCATITSFLPRSWFLYQQKRNNTAIVDMLTFTTHPTGPAQSPDYSNSSDSQPSVSLLSREFLAMSEELPGSHKLQSVTGI